MAVKSCADCKYHVCNSHCIFSGKSYACTGFCTKHRNHKRCFGTRCVDYKLDEFFKSPPEE